MEASVFGDEMGEKFVYILVGNGKNFVLIWEAFGGFRAETWYLYDFVIISDFRYTYPPKIYSVLLWCITISHQSLEIREDSCFLP